MKKQIVVTAEVNAKVEKVWDAWTNPEHVPGWNFASDDWCCPWAKNDLRVGGKFTSRMEAADGSVGFDFEGVYNAVEVNKLLEYEMADGRKVKVEFENRGNTTHVTESFDPENIHPEEMQRAGWQSILNNFKKYTENLKQ